MPLSQGKRAALINILVVNVSTTTFLEVVRDQRVLSDIDTIRKLAPEDPMEARRFIAEQVVDAYDAVGRISQLATALYRRLYLDEQFAPSISPYTRRFDQDDSALEAAIVKRAHTMSTPELRKFLEENESRVCLVAAANDGPRAESSLRTGTGFLVGPDRVLTAYHTLADHIDNGRVRAPAPGRCYAIFDYYEGDPLQSLEHLPSGPVCVPFAENWLIEMKEPMPRDGLFRQPDRQQRDMLCERLDFALVRLAEPVGRQTRRRTGGPRRKWIHLSGATLPLAQDDRIIIPQHPNGYPQRIDFGRFSLADSALDTSLTRLRYDTETERGTSGAPCFNQHFTLVGMHNASFQPDGVDVKKNQAIRIERILEVLRERLEQADTDDSTPVPLWNTSTSAEPRVILGRHVFLDWLAQALLESTSSAKERVYAARIAEVDLPKSSGFGKTFTIEILNAARRESAEPIVKLGTEGSPLPDAASDIVREIGFQLGIKKSVLETMPSRPSAELPSDKLHRWASEDVPAWFDEVLGRFREQEIDLREEARDRIEYLKAGGYAPSPDDVSLARQDTPQIERRRRWPVAWIVISDLSQTRLSVEVSDLLAGMIGAQLTDTSMPQQLRRLRWIFIGYVPDFLSADQVTEEPLHPMLIKTDALSEGISSLIDGMALSVNLPADVQSWTTIVEMFKPLLDDRAEANDPSRRLEFFQNQWLHIRSVILKLTEAG